MIQRDIDRTTLIIIWQISLENIQNLESDQINSNYVTIFTQN
jgi:hypothetical protein